MHIFDTIQEETSLAWAKLEAPSGQHAPSQRSGHTLVTLGNNVFLFGGQSGISWKCGGASTFE